MQSEFRRFEMDADELADHEAWMAEKAMLRESMD